MRKVRLGRLLAAPGHHRHGGNAVGRGPVDELPADRQVNKGGVGLVPQAHDAGFLEEQRGVFGEHRFALRQFGRQGDRAGLAAGQRKLGRILGEAEAAGQAAGAGLAHVAGHAGHLRVVEGFDADPVIGADQLPGATLIKHFWPASIPTVMRYDLNTSAVDG